MGDSDNIIGLAIAGAIGLIALIFGGKLVSNTNSAPEAPQPPGGSCKPCQLKGGV